MGLAAAGSILGARGSLRGSRCLLPWPPTMNIKLSRLWEPIRTSYWFLPALLSLFAAGFAILLLHLDETFADGIPADAWWLYGGDHDGARAVLTTIVSSMISVITVVFSITIVTLTLAAGQFGSRLLRNFMRDRGNQLTLATFIATFIYALIVLRTIRGVEQDEFVPPLAVTGAVLLMVVSMAVLIFFIHHIARSIQADTVIDTVADELSQATDRLFPMHLGQAPPEDVERPRTRLPAGFDEDTFPVRSRRAGYLQGVDDEQLMRLTAEHDLVVRLGHRPGDYITKNALLAEIWPARTEVEDQVEKIQSALLIGRNRTMTQDAEFGLQQLVEIAVRALSSGVNDPFTANSSIDRITSALAQLAGRSFPERFRFDEEGNLRMVVDTSSFAGFVNAAYNPIRQNGSESPAVLIRLMESLGEVAKFARTGEQREILRVHAELVLQTGVENFAADRDQQDLRRRYGRVLQTLEATVA